MGAKQCTNNWTFATHPKIHKPTYEKTGVIALKDASKGFPLSRPIAVLRWTYNSPDAAPLTLNCWPEDQGDVPSWLTSNTILPLLTTCLYTTSTSYYHSVQLTHQPLKPLTDYTNTMLRLEHYAGIKTLSIRTTHQDP